MPILPRQNFDSQYASLLEQSEAERRLVGEPQLATGSVSTPKIAESAATGLTVYESEDQITLSAGYGNPEELISIEVEGGGFPTLFSFFAGFDYANIVLVNDFVDLVVDFVLYDNTGTDVEGWTGRVAYFATAGAILDILYQPSWSFLHTLNDGEVYTLTLFGTQDRGDPADSMDVTSELRTIVIEEVKR